LVHHAAEHFSLPSSGNILLSSDVSPAALVTDLASVNLLLPVNLFFLGFPSR
jgi:hypothetical protein